MAANDANRDDEIKALAEKNTTGLGWVWRFGVLLVLCMLVTGAVMAALGMPSDRPGPILYVLVSVELVGSLVLAGQWEAAAARGRVLRARKMLGIDPR